MFLETSKVKYEFEGVLQLFQLQFQLLKKVYNTWSAANNCIKIQISPSQSDSDRLEFWKSWQSNTKNASNYSSRMKPDLIYIFTILGNSC